MISKALLIPPLALALATSSFSSQAQAPAPGNPDLIVVELFTSQGCSSCPPANANLGRLAGRADVLALSYSVTYWDRLGWPDTFARPEFTQRQRDYRIGLSNPNVFTPQIVVDGRADVIGGRLAEIERVMARHHSFSGPTIRFSEGGVGLAGARATADADVWLVRYEPRTLNVPIARGENGGRTLPHTHVVRQLVRLGGWDGTTVGFALPQPPSDGLATAILVQAPDGGPIIAAARRDS